MPHCALNACKSYGCPIPTLKYSSGEMWMIFHYAKSSSKDLSKTQQNIIALMKENPLVSTREIANTLGLTQRIIVKHTNTLKTEGHIKRMGPAKGGRWEGL